MPRLLGVDIPNDKKAHISLTYLYGIGHQSSRDLCHKAGIDPEKKARDLSDEELSSCLLYTSPSPRDLSTSRMPSSA